MSDNKHNVLFFENSTMQGLYKLIEDWQKINQKRLLSLSIQKDGENYCCIALTNPTEVVISSPDGLNYAIVDSDGTLRVYDPFGS